MAKIRTNPVRRLHALMTLAISPQAQQKPTAQALTLILGVSGTPIDMYRAYAKFLQLVPQAVMCVNLLPDDVRESASASFEPIIKALTSVAFHGNWNIDPNLIRQTEMGLLYLAAKEVDQVAPEDQVEDAELAGLASGLKELQNEIGVADISVKLKSLLLAEIARLLDSLTDYRITGAAGLKEAASTAFGRCVVDKEIILPEREAPSVQNFFMWVGRVGDVAQVAMTGHQLSVKVVELLGNM